ncbi:MAG: energy transducer TonB [Sulfuricellaceae bacterium]
MLLPQSPLPAVDIPLIEDPTYYTAKQVDIHPMAVEAIKPEYPEAAAAAGIEGFVTLRLLIDATGVVREISVVEAQPPDTFETAAVNAFRNARFIAAQRNDRPVKSDVRIKVMFEIIETTGARGAE